MIDHDRALALHTFIYMWARMLRVRIRIRIRVDLDLATPQLLRFDIRIRRYPDRYPEAYTWILEHRGASA